MKNSARSYCGILACNSIIARRGVPIVSLGENDLIGTALLPKGYEGWCDNMNKLLIVL